MKKRLNIRTLVSMPRLALSLTFALLTTAALLTDAQAQLPPTQNENGVVYVSGGIGQEESSAFRQAKSQYPLALTFATTSEGSTASPFASDVQVVIRNEHDANILNVTSTGPYLLARLEAGKYKVFATFTGETQSRNITIKDSGTTDIIFTWKRPSTGPD